MISSGEQLSGPEQSENTSDQDIVVLNASGVGLSEPSVAKKIFDFYLRLNPKVVLMIAAVSGAVPTAVAPHIQECIDRNIPVFLISTNYHRDSGIQSATYENLVIAIRAGAVPIRDVNINAFDTIMRQLQDSIDQGLRGADLEQAMIEAFGTVPELDVMRTKKAFSDPDAK